MSDVRLTLSGPGATRTVALADGLTPDDEERAQLDAYRWIKGLRRLPVEGLSLRDRFTYRDDSLWWFTEIYLHKTRVVLEIHRTLAALRRLIDEHRPASLSVAGESVIAQHVAAHLLRALHIKGPEPLEAQLWTSRLRRLDLRARRLNVVGRLAPGRFRGRPDPGRGAAVAAFIHRAFWKAGVEDSGAETYIGPVLDALERQADRRQIRYVGIGPATHFRSHRAWRPAHSASALIPIERFAPPRALADSRAVWKARGANLRVLERTEAIREAAVIGGIDCWPLIREELAGVTALQWPWSARSMDEAGAALDVLAPAVAVTYAEAGGWGRALVLEARRRRIATVGLQHGFIYRHWLNYRHEPDEMSADERSGFPRPTRTLLFDDYAANHLRTSGRFPEQALAVTGSPRLDALAQAARALTEDDRRGTTRRLGIHGHMLLVTTKEREARPHLPALLDAAGRLESVTVVIKPHPAESAEVYSSATAGRRQVLVLDPTEPLAPLLAVARAVVTVNSTVALDAGTLGVPALAIGLPNNLSPFVEAGAIAGTPDPAGLPTLLERILYDEKFRQELEARQRVVLGPSAMTSDGRAAERSAAAILALAREHDSRER